MRKLLYLTVAIVALGLIIAGCFSVVPPAEQGVVGDKAPKEKCATIQDGTIKASTGEIITMGYDEFGYNYQSRIFNGRYCDYDRVIGGDYCEVDLIMKWNDAWLSNKDCDGDNELDRHYGYGSYIGSGAWLTNHQWGTYWSLIGDWVLEFYFKGSPPVSVHDMTITDDSFTGTGVWLDDPNFTWAVEGIMEGNIVDFIVTYLTPSGAEGFEVVVTGTIAPDGTMSGEWEDDANRSGTWKSTMGTALCEWDYFVKIVAVPADATLIDGIWYTANDVEIGPAIWGAFAKVQMVENDACAGLHGLQYKSPVGPGFGKF